MLIVLEGLDGAGKSTQVKKLRNYLETNFGSLEYIHFPRYDAPVYGDLISRFLRGDFGSNETVHPQLVALLFAEDRHGDDPANEHDCQLRMLLSNDADDGICQTDCSTCFLKDESYEGTQDDYNSNAGKY